MALRLVSDTTGGKQRIDDVTISTIDVPATNASADFIVAPTGVVLTDDTGDFAGRTLQDVQGASEGSGWFDGSGLSDASIVETGDPVPDVLPPHSYGWSVGGIPNTRIRSSNPMSPLPELTFDLGGAFNIDGMILWNHGEGGSGGTESMRSIDTATVSFSTDGTTFLSPEAVSFTTGQQGGTNGDQTILGERLSFSSTFNGVTHVRLTDIDSFAGTPGSGNHLINFGEVRFTAAAIPEPTSFAMMAIAIVGAGLFGRRRKRTA